MMSNLKNHDVQSVNIKTTAEKAFSYIANPRNLPNWTAAFSKADEKSALLTTPLGKLLIGLETKTNKEMGTIDWHLKMPDGGISVAYSRVVPAPDGNTIYSFILLAPPVPLEQIEGALSAQMGQLSEELHKLQTILAE
ncbi:MAG: hypothetical protein J0H85_02970 [Sediminibacterium magnilacihabitans]|jgi:hypothetical protein|nr:hypothetical protein [Sediminibacterium magnilacihabitans]PQV62156.1 hypothetical protein CLV53_101431 [Sediminibacterium magnilacihabitans]